MKLALTIDNNDVQIPIPNDRCIIGRNADCDVRLPDAAVSNHHVEIVRIKGRCFIEDLSSTNGTYLNERRVMRSEIHDGDVIEVGRQRLKVFLQLDEQDDAAGESTAMTIAQQDAGSNTEHTHEQPSVQSALLKNPLSSPSRRSSIVRAVARSTVSDETQRAVRQLEQSVRKRRSRTAELPIAILRLLTGKEPEESVVLDRPTIELSTGRRCIAFVSRRPSGYYFIPASENEATRVNGVSSQPPGRALFHRDVIDVAGVAMEFRFPDAPGMEG